MKITFLIAGVQKAGTTALDAFLRQHSAIAMPSVKEVHYFDDENINWTAPDYGRFHRFFDHAKGQVLGQVTPVYSYWQPAPARIKAYNPDMKLILSLRDPVDRAYSQWEMQASRRIERLRFGAAIRKGRARVDTSDLSKSGGIRRFSYVERGFYAPQIKRLLANFPAEQLMIFDHGALKTNQMAVLDGICDFIGVPRFEVYPQNKTILPTVKRHDLGPISGEDLSYLARLYAEDTQETARLANLDLSHWKSWPTA